jgi:hypothetical protein
MLRRELYYREFSNDSLLSKSRCSQDCSVNNIILILFPCAFLKEQKGMLQDESVYSLGKVHGDTPGRQVGITEKVKGNCLEMSRSIRLSHQEGLRSISKHRKRKQGKEDCMIGAAVIFSGCP